MVFPRTYDFGVQCDSTQIAITDQSREIGMMVSVIVCTRNHAHSLRNTMPTIGRVTVPAGLHVELLIVDNGSTDNTAEIVQKANLSNIHLRYIHESRTGQCFARNRGLVESKGEVILFTDDDVRPETNWIDGMCGPIVRGEADAVAGSVRIAPHLERPWLKGDLRGWVACTDVVDLHAPGSAAGANMAFSRRVLEKVPAFDTELGPGASGFYDEALFWRQLVKAGFRLVARPEIEVEHHFDESRLQATAFRETAMKLGRSWSYMHYHWEHGRIRFVAAKLWIWRLRQLLGQFRKSNAVGADPDPNDLCALFRISALEEFVRLTRKGIRNYPRHGLVKRSQGHGVSPAMGNSELVRGIELQ